MTRVLVAFASKRGSTAEIAQAVAEQLRHDGLDADCTPAADVADVVSYDAVVLGSAVYAKRWQGEAKHFLGQHADDLARLPFWVFSSGPVGPPSKTPDRSWLEPPRIVAIVEKLGARDHAVFGGRVPAQPHGPLERAVVRGTPVEYGDRRDWDEIRVWSDRIASELHVLAAV